VGTIIIENNIIFYFGKKGILETLASCVMHEKENKIEESSINSWWQLLTVGRLEPHAIAVVYHRMTAEF
jgi:hypothetical protein